MDEGPRIAIVSDPLVQRGGAERVVETLADAFPHAPIFALLYSPVLGPAKIAPRVTASWLNSLPGATQRHRVFFPFYRSAIESIDLSDFDVIISSHHTVAKGVLTRSDQVHVSYCHTPMRALWERPAAELATLPALARAPAAMVFSTMRVWDYVTASRVQHFVANSTATRDRIAAYYRRESRIIFPPIDTEFFTPGDGDEPDDYYLIASRPVPYKRVDIAIAATALLGRKLKIVGGERHFAAVPPHVEMLGHVSNEELRTLMRRSRALLFPQLEDFGMTPLEMNACGRPTVAYGAGGALDTIRDGVTGTLAKLQTVESFVGAIERFERTSFDVNVLRNHALAFSKEHFISAIQSLVEDVWIARPQRQTDPRSPIYPES